MTLLSNLGIFSATFEISLILLIPSSSWIYVLFCSQFLWYLSPLLPLGAVLPTAVTPAVSSFCCLYKAQISCMSNMCKAVKRFLPLNRSVAPFNIFYHLVAFHQLKLKDSYHNFYVQIGEDELWLKALCDALGIRMCSCLFLVLP